MSVRVRDYRWLRYDVWGERVCGDEMEDARVFGTL